MLATGGKFARGKPMTSTVQAADLARHRLARFGGLLYLLLIPTAAPAILGGQMAIGATPGETLAAIVDGRAAFEAATLLGVIGFIDFLVLAMVLHRLFRPVCRPAADAMLAFVAVSVPLSLAAMAARLDVLNLLDAAGGLPRLAGAELEAQVALAMAGSNNLMQVAVIFWGLWLLPLAMLARASGFVPRLLAPLLIVGGLFYIVSFAGYVFDAGFAQTTAGLVLGGVGGLTAMVGEMGLAVWLLVKGTRWRAAPREADSA